MSDSEHENRDWRLYVQDIIEFGEKVLLYTDGLTEDAFISDSRIYDATLRNLQLIGRAASPVPSNVREAHPEIPWSSMIETRNRVTHDYRNIDDKVVWNIIQTDVPDLLPKLRRMLEPTATE